MRYTTAQIAAAFVTLAAINITPSSTAAERATAFRAYCKANAEQRETDAFKNVTAAYAAIKRVEPIAKPQPEQPSPEQPQANNATGDTDKPEAEAAKPDAKQADTTSGDALANRRRARALAAKAVREYYAGASIPFKAAADTFKPLNFDNACNATQRQAALLASMLLAGDNIKPTGEFVRGGFVLPDADGIDRAVQPESGCLGNMLNRVITHVSGPTSGAAQRDSVFRVNLALARVEISTLIGGSLARAAIARIDALQAPPAG